MELKLLIIFDWIFWIKFIISHLQTVANLYLYDHWSRMQTFCNEDVENLFIDFGVAFFIL